MTRVCDAADVLLVTTIIPTPVGNYELKSCHEGIHSLQPVNITEKNFNPNLSIDIKENTCNSQTTEPIDAKQKLPIIQCLNWLQTYFKNPNDIQKVPVPMICFKTRATDFEKNVWLTLTETTEAGKAITYAELANRCGHQKASRAVGTAMKKNPIPLIIPCHRVIRSDGSHGNYSTCNPMKGWLLSHESKQKKSEEEIDMLDAPEM